MISSSPDWTRPTHLREGNRFPQSTESNFNGIQNTLKDAPRIVFDQMSALSPAWSNSHIKGTISIPCHVLEGKTLYVFAQGCSKNSDVNCHTPSQQGRSFCSVSPLGPLIPRKHTHPPCALPRFWASRCPWTLSRGKQ